MKITLPDKSVKDFPKGTTPKQVAEFIGKRLASAALAAVVDRKSVDLDYQIPEDCSLKILTFADPEGVQVFRHSSAHVLAHAIQELYPDAKNTIGPSVEEGFYYDFDDLPISQDDFPKIEEKMQEIIKKGLPTKHEVWTLAQVKNHLGKKNVYKNELALEFSKSGNELTVYWQGDSFVDLCEGPHVPNTGMIGAIKLTKLAGAYWRGDNKNKQLTRIYGISFPSKKELDAYLLIQEEAAKRDHRKLGRELGLCMFHEWSPGSVFLLPKGQIMFTELQNFVREEYKKRGYQEVQSPQLFNKALWEKSGHWSHYRENMFCLKVDDEDFALKSMNCPGHTLIFNAETRSYRDLPLRIAEFTALHRNELKGVLGGLTRVRRLSQDDAHIFCTEEQIHQEIDGLIDFTKLVYEKVFKFPYVAKLATRPEKFMGAKETWDKAEKALASVLDEQKIQYSFDHGGGAFYGPKIDVFVKDALGREWQLCTMQLDFQMPQRLNVMYEGEDNQKHHCVMIHRAILGSLERFMGVLIEHFAGKFPLWLSPVQVKVLSISEKAEAYAKEVFETLKKDNIRAELDIRPLTLGKKVREAELEKVNYVLVVGEKEAQSKTVNVRTRDGEVLGEKPLASVVKDLQHEIAEKRLPVEKKEVKESEENSKQAKKKK